MSNELIRELVEALEYSSDFLSRSASRFDDVIETLAKARAYLETGGWTQVEDRLPDPCVPKNVCVERDGKRSVLRAAYAAPKTLEMNMECDGGEHDERTDEWYCPEGWYEWNEHEEIHWRVTETPRAWAPLPPTTSAGSGNGE
jgi:hypothetical protein